MICPKPYSIYIRGTIGFKAFGLLVRGPRVVFGNYGVS